MLKVWLLILTLFATCSVLFAQAGSTGMAFLKLGTGARALGMGEAFTAVADDPTATYYNPAGLSQTPSSQILLMHKAWIQDVTTEYLGADTHAGALSLGISINSTSVNNIDIRNAPGPALGSFDARNAAIGFSAAYSVNSDLSLGITGKYLYEKILINEASGLGFDLGVLYQTPWKIRLGASIANLGSMNALADDPTTLPRIFRIGGAYTTPIESMDGVLTLASDIVSVTNESATHANVGLEFEYQKQFALRAGYETGYDTKDFSAGAGFAYGILRLDYAFVPFREDFGTTHTFSLNIGIE